MASGFFGSYGERIDFDDAADLADKLGGLDLSVPGRTEGRRAEHRERWCLARYLLALSDGKLLRFPVTVEKREAPDFTLSSGNESIGLEVTDAGTQKHQKAMSRAESVSKAAGKPGTRLYREDVVLPPGQRMEPYPLYSGDAPEREWASIVRTHVERKTADLQGYPEAAGHHLLIYDNTHLIGLVPAMAEKCLAAELERWSRQSDLAQRFSLTSVLLDSLLLYDVTGAVRQLTVKDPTAGRR